MPAILYGIVIVDSVHSLEGQHPNKYSITVQMEGGDSSSYLADVTLWVDQKQDVYVPVEGNLYHLDAKVSLLSDALWLEAIRFVPVSGELTKVTAPSIMGTAAFRGSQKEGVAELLCSAYAASETADLELVLHHTARQYQKNSSASQSATKKFFLQVLSPI